MKRENEIVLSVAGFLILTTLTITLLHAQTGNTNLVFNEEFTKVGVQFKFDNGWANAYHGKIYPINESCFIIEWYRYDDETPLRNVTFHDSLANNYKLEVMVFTYSNNTKFYGRFGVLWYKDKQFNSADFDDGYLFIRDVNGLKRSYNEILKVRKYIYSVGDMR